jgi:hypothetical protein
MKVSVKPFDESQSSPSWLESDNQSIFCRQVYIIFSNDPSASEIFCKYLVRIVWEQGETRIDQIDVELESDLTCAYGDLTKVFATELRTVWNADHVVYIGKYKG